MKVLHIGNLEKFTIPFWGFLEKNFPIKDHIFLYREANSEPRPKNSINMETGNIVVWAGKFIKLANRSEKVILHGLFDPLVVILLLFQPWLLKKCYWVIWGGDLYFYQDRKKGFKYFLYDRVRSIVIKKIGHIITYIRGDYELAQRWYGAQAEHHECFMYLSNLYREDITLEPKSDAITRILIGNSASPTNNHFAIFEKLEPYKQQNIEIYCPLSYGCKKTAKNVAEEGKKRFGEKFIPIFEFMPLDKYLEFLGEIDIAVFAHTRQQGMGNSITLIGLGKKVYMRNDVVQWKLFEDIGVKVFDFENFDICPADQEALVQNKEKVREYFSEENLKRQYQTIF